LRLGHSELVLELLRVLAPPEPLERLLPSALNTIGSGAAVLSVRTIKFALKQAKIGGNKQVIELVTIVDLKAIKFFEFVRVFVGVGCWDYDYSRIGRRRRRPSRRGHWRRGPSRRGHWRRGHCRTRAKRRPLLVLPNWILLLGRCIATTLHRW
jgi:hypothetical protein